MTVESAGGPLRVAAPGKEGIGKDELRFSLVHQTSPASTCGRCGCRSAAASHGPAPDPD